jgi:hypothetical protein
MEAHNLDDSNKPIFAKIKLFQEVPIFSIFLTKCNLQE